MPISSGANGWPNSYWSQPAPKQGPPPVVVVEKAPSKVDPDTGKSRPSWPSVRRVKEPEPRAPRGPPRDQPLDSGPYKPCCCFCGPEGNYTTGVMGAGAGCCAGGLGNKSPYDDHKMPGSGRRRCCACIWGLLVGLLLLALLLGLLLGLLPYIRRRDSRTTVQRSLTGGTYINGVYYYPITDAPDTYYLAVGPGQPCNPFNNKSDTAGNTVGYETVTNSFGNETDTVSVTDPPVVTLPNCDEITTTFVRIANFSAPVTKTTTPTTTTASGTGRTTTTTWARLGLVLITLGSHQLLLKN